MIAKGMRHAAPALNLGPLWPRSPPQRPIRRKEQTPPRPNPLPYDSPSKPYLDLRRASSSTTTSLRAESHTARPVFHERINQPQSRPRSLYVPPSKAHAALPLKSPPQPAKAQRVGPGLPSFHITQTQFPKTTPRTPTKKPSRPSLSELTIPKWSALSVASSDSSIVSLKHDDKNAAEAPGQPGPPDPPEMEPIKVQPWNMVHLPAQADAAKSLTPCLFFVLCLDLSAAPTCW